MTDFLYPFIDADERDPGPLLDDLARSAAAKAEATVALRAATSASVAAALSRLAVDMSARFSAGGRLLTFGNGGSATDAASVAALFRSPPGGHPLPARSLAADEAVLTALANDVGFDLVFSRQVIAHGRATDIALGVSTSGDSANVVRALAEARSRGLLTVGFAGYEGGAMAAARLDHCIVVPSASVHRIQETQAALLYDLWRQVQDVLAPAA